MIMPPIPEPWLPILSAETNHSYWQDLAVKLEGEIDNGKTIFPPRSEWFAALEATSFDATKVIILGQDPYHGAGQAHGLSFSVRADVKIPPSLRNIYKEVEGDLGVFPVHHGNLMHWALQGVLLINTVLTVEEGKAASHQGWGWERVTDKIISALAADERPKIFMLWGNHAQRKVEDIPELAADGPHLILRAAHPSPLSAYKGFFGQRMFSQANEFLAQSGQEIIDWQLPLTV